MCHHNYEHNIIEHNANLIGKIKSMIGQINNIIGQIISMIGQVISIIGQIKCIIGRFDNSEKCGENTSDYNCVTTLRRDCDQKGIHASLLTTG